MFVPNKTISLDDSCLYRAAILLSKLESEIPVAELYASEKKRFSDLSDFIDVLDLLFVLGEIGYDDDRGVIKIA